jgi:hypothetical protein
MLRIGGWLVCCSVQQLAADLLSRPLLLLLLLLLLQEAGSYDVVLSN